MFHLTNQIRLLYELFNPEKVAGVIIKQKYKVLHSYSGEVRVVDNKQSTRFAVIQCVSSKPGILLQGDSLRVKENHIRCGKKAEEIK